MNYTIPFTSGSVTYRWVCGKCRAVHEERRAFHFGDEVWRPTMPDGWFTVQDVIYCGRHQSVVVDVTQA